MPADTTPPVDTSDAPRTSARTTENRAVRRSWLYPLVLRLHFYIGLLVGPFLLIAAFSGALYALSPQLENALYPSVLYSGSEGAPVSLEQQVLTARSLVGEPAQLAAVRPAPGMTTRVMFAEPHHGPSEHRAIFVDPVTAEVRGDMTVYGTSGILPLRIWLDYLHRNLHLGEIGRYYSELAASWLWVTTLGGTIIWLSQSRIWLSRSRRQRQRAARRTGTIQHLGRWHARTGLVLLVGLLFFSVTGLTWSRWAGDNIAELRQELGWGTPSLNTALDDSLHSPAGPHQHHSMVIPAPRPASLDPVLFDRVLATARAAGIDSNVIEIRPAADTGKAWAVVEIDRRWPTQVDAVAIDPQRLQVTHRIDFAEFPLAAKLTRWGIDAHMGILFGWPNQVLVAGLALGLCGLVITGYVMWWKRRPTRRIAGRIPPQLLISELSALPRPALLGLIALAIAVGLFLPVLGVSLLVFLVVDLLRNLWHRRRAA